MRACTIIAKNYLAQARVLAASFLEHNPNSTFSVLIIDELDGRVDPAAEPFTVLTPRDIDCEPFMRMAARYDVLELSTAVKPWLLRQQLASGDAPITYLDPDIRVFSSLELLDQRAREHGVVLTPHNTEPIPHDGERPTQVDIMIAGVYNLGCISVGQGPEIDALMDWWSDRLRRDCRVDPVYGYFVDQRWFDLAPGFVSDYAIVREPEYNVAYWNAHTRELARGEDGYTVNGRPLAFFHFSGFDPAAPELLSRHQTRIDLASHPALRQICAEYAQAADAAGYLEARQWPYTYDSLADDTPFTRPLRLLYASGEDAGSIDQPPFEQSGCEPFLTWAGEPQEGAPAGINRALAAAYGSRADLRAAFPDLNGPDRERFLQWAHERGPEELALPAALLPPADPNPAPVDMQAPEPERQWGVNVVGYFRSELGVGEAARQVVSALDACDVPLLPLHGRTIPLNRQEHPFTHLDHSDTRYPVNLICMNADALPEFAEQAGASFFADRYSIGMWFWEVTRAPDDGWKRSFEHLDEVWVPTRHVAEAVASVSPVPVVQVTLPVELASTFPLPRAALGLPDDYLFLFSYDYLSVAERKNPLATVAAFTSAFEPGAGASLVLKCINHERDPVSHARVVKAVEGHPDIHLIDTYLSPGDKNALTATCDCYVSLHRSEGFGLTMAEAMYLGKPVIATAYSGNLDFMSERNSYLVEYELVPIGRDARPYPSDGVWAEPRVDHAATLMRAVFDDREQSALRGERGAADIRRTHSPGAAGAKMVRRLDSVRERHGAPPRPSAVVAQLRPRLARGPVAPPRSRLGAVGPGLRRGVLRLMKPFTAYEKTVDDELLSSLEALDRVVKRIERDQLRSEAAGLGLERRYKSRLDELRHAVSISQALHQPIVDRLNGLNARLDRIEAEAQATPYMSGSPFETYSNPVAGVVQGYRGASNGAAADPYRAFEDIFRGSEEFIRDRQRRFVALIGDREPILDFGCGRGEFLDLLRDRGRSYVGVDSDGGMVARCKAKGHEQVVLADGLEYLEQLAPHSLGAIFCAQVIEHLGYEDLVRFFALAHRTLATDGMLIAETVNPHSPPALKTFWVDLTHEQPIFPEVALAMCQSAGFAQAFVFHPNGRGDVEADRYTQGEYAVVAQVGAFAGERAGDMAAALS
jgi:SAM-dependent methyltransferase/glycosyltransferase involved in cell wall biosynthesis